MSYQRVLPRDAFNEAKLLKCIGQISLLIHECKAPKFSCLLELRFKFDPFVIVQDSSDGSISCANVTIIYKGNVVRHCTPLNSKSNYPMQIEIDEEFFNLFEEDGSLNKMFQ